MNDGNTLESIRRAELRAAVEIEAARTAADERVTGAHRDVQRLVEEARRDGAEEADRRHRATLAEAIRAAEAITATSRIEAVRARVSAAIPDLVDEMVALVLAPPGERGA